jgi:hypothetical protein
LTTTNCVLTLTSYNLVNMTSKTKQHITVSDVGLDYDGDAENAMQRNRNIASGVQHQHHQLGLYNALPGGITHVAAVVPKTCVSNKDLHHDTTDMTGQMTPAGRRMLVRDCVKKVLFRRLKFFRKELHGMYDQSETSVCGLVIKNCNVALQDATLDGGLECARL